MWHYYDIINFYDNYFIYYIVFKYDEYRVSRVSIYDDLAEAEEGTSCGSKWEDSIHTMGQKHKQVHA